MKKIGLIACLFFLVGITHRILTQQNDSHPQSNDDSDGIWRRRVFKIKDDIEKYGFSSHLSPFDRERYKRDVDRFTNWPQTNW